MIFVGRSPNEAPEVLRSQRTLDEKKRLVELLRSASAEHLSQLRVTFDPSIWKQVKPHLLELFSKKCAYCEKHLASLDGDVEHYRPKQNAHLDWPRSALAPDTGMQSSHQHLYYAWLAYDWDNLLLVCKDCNRHRLLNGKLMGKGEAFPVSGERASFLADVAECRVIERPLLLDPCFDDPAKHLIYRETGLLDPLSERGEVTIEVLGLNLREDLVEGRRKAWEEVSNAISFVLQDDGPYFEEVEPTQTLYRTLSIDRPYQFARRSAFAKHGRQMKEAGIYPAGVLEWLKDETPGNLAQIGTWAKSELVSVRHGKYPGKKMLPEYAYQSIRRIGIRNFKALEEIEIEVPDAPATENPLSGALALLGENATGKSSILEAIALTVLGTEQIARLGVNGLACLRRSETQDAAGELRHPAEIVLTLDEGSELRLSIDLEGRFSGNSHRAAVLLGYGPRRFFSQRRDVRRFHEPWHRVKSMFDPLVRLPNPTQWLLSCTNKHFNLVVRALRTMMLLPDEAIVRRNSTTQTFGRPTVFFELEGRHESLETLSEGYKTVIAMGVDVMRELLDYWPDLENARGIVLIDEIDTHLHPRWKMRIVQRLRQALPGIQFLTSTHDPLCLRGYYDDEVQVLRRNSESSIERVVDLPNVQGLSVQQLLTSEYFGLYSTEDPTLDESIARYSTLVSKSDRTVAEDAELERQRTELNETLSLGSTPTERIFQDAIREYMLRRRGTSSAHAAQLRRETVAKVVDIWNAIDTSQKPDEGPSEAQHDSR